MHYLATIILSLIGLFLVAAAFYGRQPAPEADNPCDCDGCRIAKGLSPQAERPALTPPVVRHLSLSDRMRRKAVRAARRDAIRTGRQIQAHLREVAEAREGAHVG